MIRGIYCCSKRSIFAIEDGQITAIAKRGIAASTSRCVKKMPDRPALRSEDEFTESFLKGSGPGGQKIVCLLSALLLTPN